MRVFIQVVRMHSTLRVWRIDDKRQNVALQLETLDRSLAEIARQQLLRRYAQIDKHQSVERVAEARVKV